MNFDWKAVLAIGAIIGVGVYVARRQVIQAAKATGTAINPLSHQNIFYQGAEGVTQAVTGNKSFVSDIFGATAYDPNKPVQ